MFRRLFLKIKRYFFYKFTGFYPEDIRNLVNVQKFFDKFEREDKSYSANPTDEFITYFKVLKRIK